MDFSHWNSVFCGGGLRLEGLSHSLLQADLNPLCRAARRPGELTTRTFINQYYAFRDGLGIYGIYLAD